MKRQLQVQYCAGQQKRLIVLGLVLLAGAIILSGIFFGVYSFMNAIYFKVLNVRVPGMVFGLMVIYFGIRSAFTVNKLKQQLYSDDARFSWSNFRKESKK